MKISNMMIIGLGLLSTAALAAKLPEAAMGSKTLKPGLKAEFMNSAYNGHYYVKSKTGVQKASRLSKGEQLVTASGAPLAVLTGKLVVKLQPSVNVSSFAERYGLRLDWQGADNLVLLAAKSDADLLSLIQQVTQDSQVIRAKLDHATDKQVPM